MIPVGEHPAGATPGRGGARLGHRRGLGTLPDPIKTLCGGIRVLMAVAAVF